MSKLTVEQIKKINNGCSNGFSFDRSYFLFHNEKTLKKNIYLDENSIWKDKVYFKDMYNNTLEDMIKKWNENKYEMKWK